MSHYVVAGRSYPRVYNVSGRADLHQAVADAVTLSGGRVIYSSPATQAPFYFGIQTGRGERLGILVYPFRATKVETRNRAKDEIRGQIRFGGEDTWNDGGHPIAIDVAGVDTTLILAIDPVSRVFVGLDPTIWSPLPLGISMYARQADLDAMGAAGWSVWEKSDKPGSRRSRSRSETGSECLVAFKPHRFLDYVRFERQATDLGLDTPLRFAAAHDYRSVDQLAEPDQRHILESQFQLTGGQILDIISTRNRLAVAVRGGVAEHHLERHLEDDDYVAQLDRLDLDATHDFNVLTRDGRQVRIECKNVSPTSYANGDLKVETQKTRASKGDPSSRFYPINSFDVVAACTFSATGEWEFRFTSTSTLNAHSTYPDRLAPLQRVDSSWSTSLEQLFAQD
jgi:hypothetical protein